MRHYKVKKPKRITTANGSIAAPVYRSRLSKSRETEGPRLEACEEDLEFFETYFLGNRSSHIVRFATPEWVDSAGWSLIPGPLSDRRVEAHLAGDLWVGTGARWNASTRQFVTRYAAIDLDNRGRAPLHSRYMSVVAAVRAHPSFVFRSSASKGLHLYYLFSDDVGLWDCVRDAEGRRGAVIELLAGAGIREESGQVEVYPRGCYRAGKCQNRLRAPFGRDCLLLNPGSLEPVTGTGGVADLRAARLAFEQGNARMFDRVTMSNRASVYGLISPAVERERRRGYSAPGGPSEEEKRRVWEHGLADEHTFNSFVAAFAFDKKFGRLSQEIATAEIIEWARTKHNGKSRACLRPVRAEREIREQVERIYKSPVGSSTQVFGDLPSLTENEYRQVRKLTEGEFVDFISGEVISGEELTRFLFRLCQKAKQWLCAQAEQSVAACSDCKPARPCDPCEEAVRVALRKYLPADHGEPFIVPIPLAMRRRLKGFGRDRHLALWRVLRSYEITPLVLKSAKSLHRAACYSIWLDFREDGIRYEEVSGFINATEGKGSAPRRGEQLVRSALRKAPFSDGATTVKDVEGELDNCEAPLAAREDAV